MATCERQESFRDAPMPAGVYWVGDLCNVLQDEFHEIKSHRGISILPDGRRIASFSTIHGDGIYADDCGNEYAVDSGTIGCILADDIVSRTVWLAGGAFVAVGAPFHPRRDPPSFCRDHDWMRFHGGVLRIAGLAIELDHQ